jgi:hypothetical protein
LSLSFYLDAEAMVNQLRQKYKLDHIWLEYQLWEEGGKLEEEFRQSELRWTGSWLVHARWPQISRRMLKALLELALATKYGKDKIKQIARVE